MNKKPTRNQIGKSKINHDGNVVFKITINNNAKEEVFYSGNLTNDKFLKYKIMIINKLLNKGLVTLAED